MFHPKKNQRHRRYYPTLLERIRAARRTLQLQHWSVMQSAVSPTCFLIEPTIAKSMLATHELRHFYSDDEEDSDNASDCNSGNNSDMKHYDHDDDNKMEKGYADLHKPTKATKLLHHALTNANGRAWRRQRHCVSRAFAVDKATRNVYANVYAVGSAMEVMNKLFGNDDNSRRTMNPITTWSRRHRRNNTIDIRYFAKEVAIQTLYKIVFGTSTKQPSIIINFLHDLVLDTLELRRDEEYSNMSASIVDQLDEAVRNEIEDIISSTTDRMDNVKDTPCLVERLLQYSNSDEEYHLTKDEIVGNAHSALLAGVQTISTTLAGAMLHLAERPQLQAELRKNGKVGTSSPLISGKDVVNETLRILPPVAGLPRVPTGCGVEISSSSSSCPMSSSIQKDQLVIIDLVAFAHAQKEVAVSTDKKDSDEKYQPTSFITLQFNPMNKRRGEAAPFGIGRRTCPAGIISVECISAIIEGIAMSGVTYSIEKDNDKCLRQKEKDSNNQGWFKVISYRPTLSYLKPVNILLGKHNEIIST